jgi:cytochrome c553
MSARFLAFPIGLCLTILVVNAQPPRPGAKPKAKGEPATAGFNDAPTDEQVAFFEKKIRPVLVAECYGCHSAKAEKLKGDLRLDTRDGVRKGGDSGAAIVPGDPAKSLLIQAIKQTDKDLAMPPKKKLSDAVIADFETWVTAGAPDPRGEGKSTAVRGEIDIEKGRQFWAFQPPKKSAPPAVKNVAWAKTDIDRYLLAGMESQGLKPVADADKRTLIRRVYLDLTGLPPTGDEVEAFVFDSSPDAYEKVVDKLLTTPAFGERWARHWLDVARYAESTGKTVNFNYPNAWRYRDYVIAAFNADKPYDVFIQEQLAGDLMPAKDDKQKAERIVATGFLAIGPKALNERMRNQFEMDVADEQIDVTSQAFLGLTAACARCHDHKFDPIPQKDYYALAGIFKSTETCYGTIRFVQSNHPSSLISLPKDSAPAALTKLTDTERKQLEDQIAALEKQRADNKDQIRNLFFNSQISINRSKLDSYESDGTPKLRAMGVRDKPAVPAGGRGPFGGPGRGGPPGMGMGFGPLAGGQRTIADSPVYTRGEIDHPGPTVPRGVLQVVTKSTPTIKRTESGRLELADWIASKNNPLTARVMVNRIWLHLFGRGIVPTPDNFGAAGQPPSNPHLLDFLAVSFMDHSWSVKKLIKQIVTTRAYRLASTGNEKNLEIDPDNEYVWRMTPRRLDAEVLRDSMLAVGGQLSATPPVGSPVAKAGEGPSTRPRLGSMVGQNPNDTHRSIYLPIIRDNLPESLALFDAADASMVVAERAQTTVPAQALFLMNNPFVIRQAQAAADKLIEASGTETERIRHAYLNFFGRPPTDAELSTAQKFLKDYRDTPAAPPQGRGRGQIPAAGPRSERNTWTVFCQALFASAEFLYRN